MQTKIINTDQLSEAITLLNQDEIVAFPTETVYGLAARIDSPEAIQKIYQAKGRPSDNPLIAHVSSWEMIEQITDGIPETAHILAKAFWPGPLTLVFKKNATVSDAASAGLTTIGIRWPAHPIAQEIIQQVGVALVAPSANRSGFPSPTTAQHVFNDLDSKIPLIIDGGVSEVGIESTVVDLSGEFPTLLRPGSITREEIENVLGYTLHNPSEEAHSRPAAPGMKYRHYAPEAQVVLVDQLPADFSPEKDMVIENVTMENLYALLRQADQEKKSKVFVIVKDTVRSQEGLWNRLKKAASK